MLKEEFITNYAVGDRLVSVGLDDSGQCYFIEWAEGGEIKEESCGSYNADYKGYIEYKFGDPIELCPYYDKNEQLNLLKDCDNKNKFGYCDHCKFQNVKWWAHNLLVDLGITDRRGNILEPFQDYLGKKDD